MPSRSGRRRRHKRLSRAEGLGERQRRALAAALLRSWRAEAFRRAADLSAEAAWALASDPQVRALAAGVDPSGELQSDLDRACAEAVAAASGRALVRGSRPLGDRCRTRR